MTNTESSDSKGPNKSRAKSCRGPCVKGVDLIGSGWAGLLTSWHPKYVLQKSFCLFVNPGPPYPYTCPSCASVRTHGLNLLGITILVPWGFSLPITRSSLATDYVLLELTIPPGSTLYMLMPLTEFFCLLLTLLQSRVLSLRRVAVTATNLTNSSDALCTAKGPAWFSACSKRDKESTMFCSPGKYLTSNL